MKERMIYVYPTALKHPSKQNMIPATIVIEIDFPTA